MQDFHFCMLVAYNNSNSRSEIIKVLSSYNFHHGNFCAQYSAIIDIICWNVLWLLVLVLRKPRSNLSWWDMTRTYLHTVFRYVQVNLLGGDNQAEDQEFQPQYMPLTGMGAWGTGAIKFALFQLSENRASCIYQRIDPCWKKIKLSFTFYFKIFHWEFYSNSLAILCNWC